MTGRRASAAVLALLGLLLLQAGSTARAATWIFTVTDGAGHPLDHAVVAVQVKGAPTSAAAGSMAELGQRNRSFVPHVLAIQTGTTVSFPNYDMVRHHVYSFSAIRPFELKLYSERPPKSILFDKPGTAVLGCNIHDQMLGWIHVVDTPLFSTTDASGTARLELPPGDHRLSVWQAEVLGEGAPLEQDLAVGREPGRVAVQLVPH